MQQHPAAWPALAAAALPGPSPQQMQQPFMLLVASLCCAVRAAPLLATVSTSTA
eukprot:COSAG01_NODE_58119_length_308_cov_0.578947_1_plen_53_part_01